MFASYLIKLKKIIFLLTIVFGCLLWCSSDPTPGIRELIQPVNLRSGVADTIPVGDLFFARDYLVSFKSHDHISVSYQKESQTLILQPDTALEGLVLIDFEYSGNSYVLPLRVGKRFTRIFSYTPDSDTKSVSLFGSFNNWNRENLPLRDEDRDGTFKVSVALDPGRYEYKFFVDGKELLDPLNPDKISNPFGSYNSVITISPSHSNRSYLHLLNSETENGSIKITFHYNSNNPGPGLEKKHIHALLGNFRLDEKKITVRNQFIEVLLNQADLSSHLPLRVAVSQEGLSTHFQEIPPEMLQSRLSDRPSFSWKDAIVYAIMVDRFFDGDSVNNHPVVHPDLDPRANFYGGDLQGIIQKIDEGYFSDLGVNVLWLSPINQNPLEAFREYPPPHRYYTGYHGYWPIHHEKVDFRFGNMDQFKKLVEKAHDKGIKVILDFVSNHVHQEHPFFKEHPDWFGELKLPDGRDNIRMWDEYRLTTWFDTYLPSFDYQGSSEALQVMTDNAVWWMTETGIDGFRQDAVKHVPNSFWRTLTRKLKREVESKQNKTIYQIGETFGGYDLISSYVNNGQLTAQFNFNLYDVAIKVFLEPQTSFQILNDEMMKTFDVYGVNHLMGNLMDSHDKVRYLAYADGDIGSNSGDTKEIGWQNPPRVDHPESYQKARLYLAYLLTIPGVPVIYYGDEIGMTGAADPDNRRPMRFGEDLSPDEDFMLEKVAELIQLRKEHSALRVGDFYTAIADQNIYAYFRSDLTERLLVILNKSEVPRDIFIKIPDEFQILAARDLVSGQTLAVNKSLLQARIGKQDWQIFELKGN